MSYKNLLANNSLFAGLDDDALDGLATLVVRRQYRRGEVIFHAGDSGASLCIVRQGEVAIRLLSEDGKEMILTLLGPEDSFGELSLIDGQPRSADAVAREPTQLLMLGRESFLGFLNTHPMFAQRLLINLTRIVRRLTETVHDASFLDVRSRLAKKLLQLARSGGGKAGHAGQVELPALTQTELANLIGVTRESVNKILRSYEKNGLIRQQDGALVLIDLDGLEEEIVTR